MIVPKLATLVQDNTTTRVKGYGKLKEDKDIISDQSMSYESKTGEWSYDSSLKADNTKKIGATFTFSFTGTGFKFKTLVSKLGGKWEFKIGDKTKSISVYKDSAPTEKEFDIIRGLDSKTYKVVATFKGRDSNNPKSFAVFLRLEKINSYSPDSFTTCMRIVFEGDCGCVISNDILSSSVLGCFFPASLPFLTAIFFVVDFNVCLTKSLPPTRLTTAIAGGINQTH